MRYLIVVDMQNDFVTGSLGSKMAEMIVPAAVSYTHLDVYKRQLLLFLRKILLKQAARLRALSSIPKTLTPATLTVRKRLTKCAR